jgi:hypothetical protein
MPRRQPKGPPDPLPPPELPACALCRRPQGRKVEWHHLIPKSRGGTEMTPVHPICHRTIHATLTNREIERSYATPDALRAHPELARFIAWVSSKDPDFHSPTRANAARDDEWRKSRKH